jgi:hypothetical protein
MGIIFFRGFAIVNIWFQRDLFIYLLVIMWVGGGMQE